MNSRHLRQVLGAMAAGLLCLPALGCEYPDEGNMPLRRAVTRVQMLPEAQQWKQERLKAGEAIQFRLSLEPPVVVRGRCHWTVEALADGKAWRRFYVTPDGKHVLTDPNRSAPHSR